jgi:4-hydroxy-4-methyl-2-oxoglutarate aldolase
VPELATSGTGTAAVSAATVHEAAGRRGALPSRIKPVRQSMQVHGPAFTVQLPPGDNLGLHRALGRAAPGDVLVAHAGGQVEYGYWGEILNEAALARGLAGLVIDGGVRDVAQLRASGFPVFSAGVCIRGTIKDPTAAIELDRTIRIGDVPIRPRDLVVGDADGVVVIPAADAAAVLRASAERDRHEQSVIERIRAGESTLDIYGLDPGPQ